MVIHVGIFAESGDLSYYKEGKKKGQHLKIISVKHDDEIVCISSMYDEIKSKIGLNFGNVCICLDEKYHNEIREEFIEQGLNCGFKNIKIINSQTLLYLNAMSEIKYKPLNGNAIWIESEKNFYLWNLWKIIGKKAVYFGEFNGDSSRLEDLQSILTDSKMNKGPDIVVNLNEINKINFGKISHCQFFSYKYTSTFSFSKACLLKAQMISGNPDLIYLETESFLSQKIIVKIENEEIKSFEIGEILPLQYSDILNNISGYSGLEIEMANQKSEFIDLPSYDEINFNFKIDENEIYSVNFGERLNEP